MCDFRTDLIAAFRSARHVLCDLEYQDIAIEGVLLVTRPAARLMAAGRSQWPQIEHAPTLANRAHRLRVPLRDPRRQSAAS